MNTKTKSNLKRTLAVFLTLLMLMTSWVFVAPSAAAEGEPTLVGRYFSTDNIWFDASKGENGVQWQFGDYPAYSSKLGMTYFNGMYVRLDHANQFSGVNRDTGLTFAFNYRPNFTGDHRHILSLGQNAYGGSPKNHLYISGTTSWNSEGAFPQVGWVDGTGTDGTELIDAHPVGVTPELGKEYNIVITIDKDDGVTFYVDGEKKTTAYTGSNKDDQIGNICSFLDEVSTYGENYIGCSRWTSDAKLEGYLSDVRIYAGAMTEEQVYPMISDMLGTINLTAPVFSAVAYHTVNEATGAYSNLVYASYDDTAFTGGDTDGYKEVGAMLFKVITPRKIVMAYDGVNDVYSPIELETKKHDKAAVSNQRLKYVASDTARLPLAQYWYGYQNGGGDNYKIWAGPQTGNWFSQVADGAWDLGQDNTTTPRFWWNKLQYTGSGDTIAYYEQYQNITFSACSPYENWGNHEPVDTLNSESNYYVLNYAPVYSVLSAASTFNSTELSTNAWKYTDQSLAKARLAMRRLTLCNPNLYDYNDASAGRGVDASVKLSAAAIKQAIANYNAINLIKKTGTVYWNNWNGNNLETDPAVNYGDVPTYDGAQPQRTAGKDYYYTFNEWTPTPTAVTEEETTYTAAFDAHEQSYTATVTDDGSIGNLVSGVTVTYDTDYTFTPEMAVGKSLMKVDTATVTIDGASATAGTDYSLDAETGAVTVFGAKILGDVTIAYTTVPKTFSVTVNGANLQQPSGGYADATAYVAYEARLTPAANHKITGISSVTVNGANFTSFGYNAGTKTVTIPAANVTGDIVINVTTAAESYDLTFGGEVSNEGVENGVTYGENCVQTLTALPGYYINGVSVKIGANDYPDFSLSSNVFPAQSVTVTVPGADITDDVKIIADTGNSYAVAISGTNVAAATDTAYYSTEDDYTSVAITADTHYHITGIQSVTVGGAATAYTFDADAKTVTISGTAITGAVEIVATAAIDTYTVTFKNGSTVLGTPLTLGWDSPVAYSGAEPTRDSTAQYSYAFNGWTVEGTETFIGKDDPLPNATADVTYVASFAPTVRSYTVTFKNGDTVLGTPQTLAYGSPVAYSGAEPTKAADAQYTYTFDGWNDGTNDYDKDDTLPTVSGTVTYTAKFASTVNKYKVTFLAEDGATVLKVSADDPNDYREYDYGTAAANIAVPTVPEKAATAQYTYTFGGWDPALAEVKQDATYTVTYTANLRSYTVTFKNGDTVLGTPQTLAYGSPVSYSGAEPTKAADARYTYTFSGWNDGTTDYGKNDTLPTVSGTVTYTATYTETPQTYTASVIGANITTVNNTATYGTPYEAAITAASGYHVHGLEYVKVGDTTLEEGDYTFVNGTVTIPGTAVLGNIEIKAVAALNAYTITWVLHGGSVETSAEDGEVPSYTVAPYTENGHVYKFSAWDTTPVAATGNATYTANYALDKDDEANVHDWLSATYVPTEADGVISKVTASKTCDFCGKILTEEATVGNGLTSVVTKEATCKAAGETTYTATFSDAFATQTYVRANIAIDENAHTYDYTNITYAWAEKEGGYDYVATIPCANDESHTPLTVNATVEVTSVTADCSTKASTTYTATFEDARLTGDVKTVEGDFDLTKHTYNNADASFAWVKPEGQDWQYIATIPCAKNSEHDAKVVVANVTVSTADANCTTPGDTTYTATGFPAESGLSLPAGYENKVVSGETNGNHDWNYNDPIITAPVKDGEVWGDGSVVYACTRNAEHKTEALAVARANYGAYDAEIEKVEGFLSGNDLNGTVRAALQSILDTPLQQNLVTLKDGVNYDGHTAFDQQSTVDAAVANMRLALADVLDEYATPDGEGGYTFNENALQTYSVVFTDNLGGSDTVEQPAGKDWYIVKEGYKLVGITAEHGTADLANAKYTFTNSADTVTLTFAVDVDAVLAAAGIIVENQTNYDNNEGFLDRLQAAYGELTSIQNDPEQNARAAELKQTLLDLIDESHDHKKDGASCTVTFIYGKNDDVPAIINTTVGATVTAPSAHETSYTSAGFSYPVAYWVDAENNRYTTSFPAATDGAVYHAVYTLYDLIDDLAAIRAARERENVIGGADIAAMEDILSQINTLFADHGVTVSEYRTVQANAVDRETEEGQAFITALHTLIGQFQSVSESAEAVCEGHQYDYYDQKVPSCTEPGYTAYKVCRICLTKVGGTEIPATGHSAHYDRDAVRSGALGDGTCTWDTYTCNNGCGDFYLIPVYIARYSDGSTIAGATVTLFADGHNISVVTDASGRANFRGLVAPGQLREGEYALTVSIGETAKTGTMYVHNGRVTISIARIDNPGSSGGGEGEGGGSEEFRCPMCGAYEELRTMPVVGWFVAIVHFFVHMAYRIINASTAFSGKWTGDFSF